MAGTGVSGPLQIGNKKETFLILRTTLTLSGKQTISNRGGFRGGALVDWVIDMYQQGWI